jgi:RES domain
LREINWQEKEAFLYSDFLADSRAEFHDIRDSTRFTKCLDPNSYTTSQKLAHELLDVGSAGVVYPSVRHSGGTCISCFRPALVNNVHKGGQISVEFENAFASPVIRPAT